VIKVSANLSKKVPMPGVEYSSQQFGASLEIEVSDADKPESIKARIQELYRLLTQTVDEQIAGASKPAPASAASQPEPAAASTTPRWKQTGNAAKPGNGHQPVPATAAQCKAIEAICSKLNVATADVLADYKVNAVNALTVKQASKVIDALKKEQANRR